MLEVATSLTIDPAIDAHSSAHVKARFSDDVQLDDQRLRMATTHLTQVAQRGGFAIDAGPSSLDFLRFDVIAPQTAQWTMTLKNCDPRVFEILREMLARDLNGTPVCRSVEVIRKNDERSDRRLIAWPTETTDHDAYPGLTTAAAGLYSGISDNLSKSRRVLVEQMQPASADRIADMAAWIEPWAKLLEGGGFAMPVGHPSTTESVFGGISQYSEREVEIAIDRFLASENAWNVLVNMLVPMSTKEQTIVRIELD